MCFSHPGLCRFYVHLTFTYDDTKTQHLSRDSLIFLIAPPAPTVFSSSSGVPAHPRRDDLGTAAGSPGHVLKDDLSKAAGVPAQERTLPAFRLRLSDAQWRSRDYAFIDRNVFVSKRFRSSITCRSLC